MRTAVRCNRTDTYPPTAHTFYGFDARTVGTLFLDFSDSTSVFFELPEGVSLTSETGIEFTVSIISVPATVWLFGSGLLGLFGIARRARKRKQLKPYQQWLLRARGAVFTCTVGLVMAEPGSS